MRRGDSRRLLLWAILALSAAVLLALQTSDNVRSINETDPAPRDGTYVDSLSIILFLYEGWGKCEMEKPGHIIFPSDTALRQL